MKHIFIINANANKGNNDRVFEKLVGISNSLGLDYHIIETKNPKETKRIVGSFSNEVGTIIYAVGGDGTVNEIVNSFRGNRAMLGVIPMGSGNDFYRSLKDFERDIVECSIMQVNDRMCINIFSLGIDAEIAKNAEAMKKIGIPASQIYNVGIVYTLFKHQPNYMLIDIDGQKYYDLFNMFAVCNGQYYGNGYHISTYANLEHEEARICMAANVKKIIMPNLLLKIIKGTHEKDPHFNILSGRRIKITTDYPVVANVDGEQIENDEFVVDTCAKKIKVYNPREIIRQLKK